jgi:hypothetical protein
MRVRGSDPGAAACVLPVGVSVEDLTQATYSTNTVTYSWTNLGPSVLCRMYVTGDPLSFGPATELGSLDDEAMVVGLDADVEANQDITGLLQVMDSCGQWRTIATVIFNTGN